MMTALFGFWKKRETRASQELSLESVKIREEELKTKSSFGFFFISLSLASLLLSKKLRNMMKGMEKDDAAQISLLLDEDGDEGK